MTIRIALLGLILGLASTDESPAGYHAPAPSPAQNGPSAGGLMVSRTSVGVRWDGPGSRNQITFTHAPELPYLLAIAGTMGAASLVLTYRRIG